MQKPFNVHMHIESIAQEDRVTEMRLKSRWESMDMEDAWVRLKAREQALCNDYITEGSAEEASRRSDGNYSSLQAKNFLKSKKAINYLTVMREQMNTGVQTTYNWKLDTLAEIVDGTKGGEPRTAISAISEMNKMQGHHAPVSTVVTNIEQDDYIKQINVVAQRIMSEEKNEEYEGELVDE